MNTNTGGFWALAALASSVLAVPTGYSQAELLANQHTERFPQGSAERRRYSH